MLYLWWFILRHNMGLTGLKIQSSSEVLSFFFFMFMKQCEFAVLLDNDRPNW